MANPYITGFPWAGGNYAAGADPWAAQPRDVLPAANFFTPNLALAAEEVNYILNQRDNCALWLNARIGPYFLAGRGLMSQQFTTGYKGWGNVTAYAAATTNQGATPGPAYQGLIGGLLPSDVVEVAASYTMNFNVAAVTGYTRLEGIESASVGNPPGNTTALASSEQVLVQAANAIQEVTMRGIWTVTTGAVLSLYQNGKVQTAVADANWAPLLTGGVGYGCLTYQVWRPT